MLDAEAVIKDSILVRSIPPPGHKEDALAGIETALHPRPVGLNALGMTPGGEMIIQKHSPCHQKGEQGLLFKDLGTSDLLVKIDPFNQIFKFETVARPSRGGGPQTLKGKGAGGTMLWAHCGQWAQKLPTRHGNTDSPS
jgi:hypothetical protein